MDISYHTYRTRIDHHFLQGPACVYLLFSFRLFENLPFQIYVNINENNAFSLSPSILPAIISYYSYYYCVFVLEGALSQTIHILQSFSYKTIK